MASGVADPTHAQKEMPMEMAPPSYDASMQQGVAMTPGPVTSPMPMAPGPVTSAMPMAPGPVTSAMPMAPGPVAMAQQVVVTQQPGMTVTSIGPQKRNWNSEICGCCMDPVSCLGAFCCTPFYLCHTLTRMGENCCVGWLPWSALPAMRSNFRGEHNIYGDLCSDVCTSWWCSCCVLAQLSREIDYVNQQPTAVIIRQ